MQLITEDNAASATATTTQRKRSRPFRLTKAQQDIVTAHYGLVISVAREFCGPRGRVPDHIQSGGFLGLCRAAHKYRPETGVPFVNFACLKIKSAMLDAHREEDTQKHMGIPRHYRAIMDDQGPSGDGPAGAVARHQIEAVLNRVSIGHRDSCGQMDPPDPATVPGHESHRLEIAEEALAKLATVYKLGHRVTCMSYGLEGYPQCGRREIARILGLEKVYVDSIMIWAHKILRDFAGGRIGRDDQRTGGGGANAA